MEDSTLRDAMRNIRISDIFLLLCKLGIAIIPFALVIAIVLGIHESIQEQKAESIASQRRAVAEIIENADRKAAGSLPMPPARKLTPKECLDRGGHMYSDDKGNMSCSSQ